MRIKLHPDARAELRAARNWYHERSPLSAIAFAQAVNKAISKIRGAPNTFPLADHGTRKFTLQQFPFTIFYRTDETEIVIVAVAHQKRRPGYRHRRRIAHERLGRSFELGNRRWLRDLP